MKKPSPKIVLRIATLALAALVVFALVMFVRAAVVNARSRAQFRDLSRMVDRPPEMAVPKATQPGMTAAPTETAPPTKAPAPVKTAAPTEAAPTPAKTAAPAETPAPASTPQPTPTPGPAVPAAAPGASPTPLPEYAALYERNHDFFGWISVEGTNVDLPVMYAPDRPLQYLGHDFDGRFSYAGVPFIEPECDPNGQYLLVYGHHMRDGTVFAGLLSYEDPDFWAEHPTFRFDTRFEHRTYAVVAAFRARVLLRKEKGFRYYNYTALDDEATFREFMTGIRAMAAYDTGVETSLGDEILTLSTCAYHVDNGRFVVVAKRVE